MKRLTSLPVSQRNWSSFPTPAMWIFTTGWNFIPFSKLTAFFTENLK